MNEGQNDGGGGGPVRAPMTSSSSSSSSQKATRPLEKKDFASTHRVKKLLETYSLTAERSLMGPDASGLEEAIHAGKYFYGGQARSSYKLPPDVELSKTSPNNKEDEMDRVKRLANAEATSTAAGLKGGGPPASPPPPGSHMQTQNGLVTLSRIDTGTNGPSSSDARNTFEETLRARHASERHRNRSGDSNHSSSSAGGGSGNRHLTGEMIRQLNAYKKLPQSGGSTTAAAAAAASVAFQQQMQMQAVYERALKEKSYLRYKSNSGSSDHFKTPTATATSSSTTSSLVPVFSSRDRGQADLSETRLAARDISCFEVGGERRCCLPQILNSVLDQISLQAIHAACDELQIYCSTCTPEQLEMLKMAKIIPVTASQCGLITKSDAERLCAMLLERTPPLASLAGFHATASPFSFRVQHECFGKCRGIVLPEAYTSPTARCIECLECEGLFCPPKFVCHSHRNRENRTCHWGFDSANWRAYLHLADDYMQSEKDKLNKTVSDFKARYVHGAAAAAVASKRKQADPSHLYHGHHMHNGGPDKSSKIANPPESKKPRVEGDFPGGVFPGDTYGMYLYQSWAAAAAAGKGPPAMHPAAAAAAAAAWSAQFSQAVKDGKTPMAPPPGFPTPSGVHGGSFHRASFDTKLASSQYHHHHHQHSLQQPQQQQQQQQQIGPTNVSPTESRHPHPHHTSGVKSSPLSESGGSPSDRMSHSIDSSSSPNELVSANHLRRSTKPSSSSLAEDIHSIRLALDGASVTAKEKTLKTLERLTARLALAESERDMALDQLRHLQKRFDRTEEELHKKRAELREALHNDGNTSSQTISHHHHGRSHGNGESSARSSVTFEPIITTKETEDPSSYVGKRDFSGRPKYVTALPKMDIKSPARVLEEKERSCGSSRSSRSSLPATSPPPAVVVPATAPAVASGPGDESPITSDVLMLGSAKAHLRRRSGTPVSVRSRESEDLRERMMTMEAELRALRDELSHRPSYQTDVTEQQQQTSEKLLVATKKHNGSKEHEEEDDKVVTKHQGNGNGNGNGDISGDNNKKIVEDNNKKPLKEGNGGHTPTAEKKIKQDSHKDGAENKVAAAPLAETNV